MEKDPNTYTGLFDIFKNLWVLIISVAGGIIHNFRRIKKGELKRFRWVELAYDTSTSGFVGMMTYYLCIYYALPDPLIGFTCGSAGMAGGYGLNLARTFVSGKSIVEINIKEKEIK